MFSTGIVSNIIKRWELKTNELWVAVKWVSWRRFYARRACVVCATVDLIMEFSFLKQKSYILFCQLFYNKKKAILISHLNFSCLRYFSKCFQIYECECLMKSWMLKIWMHFFKWCEPRLFQFLWHCPGFTIFCQTTAITLQALLTYLTKHSFLLKVFCLLQTLNLILLNNVSMNYLFIR